MMAAQDVVLLFGVIQSAFVGSMVLLHQGHNLSLTSEATSFNRIVKQESKLQTTLRLRSVEQLKLTSNLSQPLKLLRTLSRMRTTLSRQLKLKQLHSSTTETKIMPQQLSALPTTY